MIIAYLLFAIIPALIVYKVWYNSPKQKGKRGELKVISELSRLPDDYVVFNDVVLSGTHGTTQIDHIVVSKYGILAIETKNYRGDIFGSDNSDEWKQIIVTKVRYKRSWKTYTYVTKNKLYNPVKQSLGHCYAIKRLIPSLNYVPVTPVVVFVGDSNLEGVSTSHPVFHIGKLIPFIKSQQTVYLTDAQVKDVCLTIEHQNVRESVTDSQHTFFVAQKVEGIRATINSGHCPKCGGELVRRRGKYGTFYGCSNYPRCRYTLNI